MLITDIISEDYFIETVLNSDIPVLVDFYAPWCAPCRAMEPLVEQVAEMFDGKIKCVKVNIDEVPDLSIRYSIINIPMVFLFTKGEVFSKIPGLRHKNDYVDVINDALSRDEI
jgi:thioredoxin 1